MYAPMLTALFPTQWRNQPKSARFSGNVNQWTRMGISVPQQAHGDIEMQLPTRKDKVTMTVVTTVEIEKATLFTPPPIPTDLRDHDVHNRDGTRLTR
jgi:hypothetical protein